MDAQGKQAEWSGHLPQAGLAERDPSRGLVDRNAGHQGGQRVGGFRERGFIVARADEHGSDDLGRTAGNRWQKPLHRDRHRPGHACGGAIDRAIPRSVSRMRVESVGLDGADLLPRGRAASLGCLDNRPEGMLAVTAEPEIFEQEPFVGGDWATVRSLAVDRDVQWLCEVDQFR